MRRAAAAGGRRQGASCTEANVSAGRCCRACLCQEEAGESCVASGTGTGGVHLSPRRDLCPGCGAVMGCGVSRGRLVLATHGGTVRALSLQVAGVLAFSRLQR